MLKPQCLRKVKPQWLRKVMYVETSVAKEGDVC